MPADSANDVSPNGEPSFVSVAICVGSDFDGQPVTLIDRICLNRSAAIQMSDDMSICVQQQEVAERESKLCSIQLDNQTDKTEWYQMTSAIAGLFLMILFAAFYWTRKV